MPLYLLDTDTLSLWQQGHATVAARIASHRPNVATTIISVEEQVLGRITAIRQLKRADQVARAYESFTTTVNWLRKLDIVTYSEPAVRRYGQLRKQKLGVGGYDLRIAAIALEIGATVATKNYADFTRVPDLAIVDWSA
jgi:tRNA(fMet)-specific endonuclease VapC